MENERNKQRPRPREPAILSRRSLIGMAGLVDTAAVLPGTAQTSQRSRAKGLQPRAPAAGE
jgi:hypothetical protein